MKLITLIENTSETEKLQIENGISFYVEHAGANFVIDFGASDRLMKNASKMQINLSRLSFAVLTRNDDTCTGGAYAVIRANPGIKLFAQREVKNDYYINSGVFTVPNGLPVKFFDKYADHFVLYNTFQQCAANGKYVDGVYLMTAEYYDERWSSREKSSLVRHGGKYIKDDLYADSFCVIFPGEEKDGCIIVAPAARTGLPNIVATVRENWVNVNVLAIICGFEMAGKTQKHLNCSPDFCAETADALRRLNVGQIYACHSTGQRAYDVMKETLSSQLQYLRTGEMLEF
ncbi:MAG: MBL fold metallo-hydrolase [Oscillospiraceae bacterium]|nr:MBL fold metallo-hydrolase [Oscillospiraceae bacterium]